MEEMEIEFLTSMNRLRTSLILIFICFSISSCKKTITERKAINSPETNIIDTILVSKEEKNLNSEQERNLDVFIPDTTVNNKLSFHQPNSLNNFYSFNSELQITDNGKMREFPFVCFVNESGNQYLIAYLYEGSMVNSFSCFEIGYLNPEDNIYNLEKYQIQEKDFYTESGLKLGLDKNQVIKIKGNNYRVEEKMNKEFFIYTINNYSKSEFLKRYSMPSYTMKVEFNEIGKVEMIYYGFDYP